MKGIWVETFVKIDTCRSCRQHRYILDQFVEKCWKTMIKLEEKKPIDRMCWLVHNKDSGVPYGREGTWFHFRMRLAGGSSIENLKACLSRKFEMTRVVEEGSMDEIAGVDLTLFKGGAEEAWDIICGQSYWVWSFMRVQRYVANAHMCRQFLHYFANMLQQSAS